MPETATVQGLSEPRKRLPAAYCRPVPDVALATPSSMADMFSTLTYRGRGLSRGHVEVRVCLATVAPHGELLRRTIDGMPHRIMGFQGENSRRLHQIDATSCERPACLRPRHLKHWCRARRRERGRGGTI